MHAFRISLFLAYKAISRGHRSTIALMLLILSLSFVNLVFIAAILGGITVAIQQQVVRNLTSHLVIDPQEEPTKKDFIVHQGELRRQIEQLPGVLATARRYKLAATVAYDKEKNARFKLVSTEVLGVDPEAERRVTSVADGMLAGRYLEGLGSGEVILGADLAGGYGGSQDFTSLGGVNVGDKVRVTFSNGVERTYRVRGIYRVRLGLVDRAAFITAKEAESVLGVYNGASQILVRVDAARWPEAWYLDQIRPLAPRLKMTPWSDLMGELGNITNAFNMIALVVSAVGLVVAATTIFILIYVHAMNKRRQIGVLKAIGIRQSIIVSSYVLQALFYSVCGITIGLIITFVLLAPYFTRHPLSLPIGDTSLALDLQRILYSALSLLAAGAIAGFVPSRQVAKQNILKAIWGA